VKVLAIETSCDETAAAVVADGRVILSNVVASQIEIHARYGGVVPEVASRQHVAWIVPVVEKALSEAEVTWHDIDLIAVTYGPGLAGSLLVGVNTAKAVAMARRLPLVGVNHLEGHVYANWLVERSVVPPDADPETIDRLLPPPRFPVLCLIVSGGHSDLVLIEDHGVYRALGHTRDDAAGEAFDKVARILGLGYPGGPAIQLAAAEGQPEAFPVPRAWLKDTFDFSFSGVKTAMLRLANECRAAEKVPLEGEGENEVAGAEDHGVWRRCTADLAASFQESVVDVLTGKTVDAAGKYAVKEILLAGGVAANKRLREVMVARSPIPVRFARPSLCTDNAAMIASAGYFHFQRGQTSSLDLDVCPNLRLVA